MEHVKKDVNNILSIKPELDEFICTVKNTNMEHKTKMAELNSTTMQESNKIISLLQLENKEIKDNIKSLTEVVTQFKNDFTNIHDKDIKYINEVKEKNQENIKYHESLLFFSTIYKWLLHSVMGNSFILAIVIVQIKIVCVALGIKFL